MIAVKTAPGLSAALRFDVDRAELVNAPCRVRRSSAAAIGGTLARLQTLRQP
jgi:hypothetical protein